MTLIHRLTLSILAWFMATQLLAYSANKVAIEDLPDGSYRVTVRYTVPALKEFREAHAVFRSQKEAQAMYWHLMRGGDFSVGGKAQLRFDPVPSAPDPY